MCRIISAPKKIIRPHLRILSVNFINAKLVFSAVYYEIVNE